MIEELARQSRVFFDEHDNEHEAETETDGNATASDAESEEYTYGDDDRGPLADIDIGAGEGVLGRTLQTMDVGVERALARGVRAAGAGGAMENVDPLLETAGASGDANVENGNHGEDVDEDGEYATPIS